MWKRLHLLPAGIALLVPVSFLITYVIAVCRGDVRPLLPYVSMAGTNPPESCFFSLMLNMAAYLLGACVYLRYLYVKKFARFRHSRGARLNTFATWTGMASCLGLDMVANFQVSLFPLPHYVGAVLCFFGSIVYFYLQTIVSYKMVEGIETERTHLFRTWLSVSALILFIVVFASGIAAESMVKGDNRDRDWLPADNGYSFHITSTSCEWLLVIVQGSLLLTFLPAFTCITITAPVLKIAGVSETSIEHMQEASPRPTIPSNSI